MHLRSRTVLAVSLLLSLAACGGEEPVVDPEIGLEGPAELLLHPGSSRSVTLSLPLATHGYEDHSVWALEPYGPTYFPDVRFGYGTSVALPMAHLPTGDTSYVVALGTSLNGEWGLLIQPLSGPLDAPLETPAPLKQLSPTQNQAVSEDSLFVIEPSGVGVHTFQLQTLSGFRLVHTEADRVTFSDFGPGLLPEEVIGWTINHDTTAESMRDILEEGSSLTRQILLTSGLPFPLSPRTHAMSVAWTRLSDLPVGGAD